MSRTGACNDTVGVGGGPLTLTHFGTPSKTSIYTHPHGLRIHNHTPSRQNISSGEGDALQLRPQGRNMQGRMQLISRDSAAVRDGMYSITSC
jgi:hypothetical protein